MDIINLDEEKLREACNYGDMELINSFLIQGVDVNSQNIMNGWSGLHWACKRGHTDAVRVLLSHGADPNVKNFKNETPAQLVTKEEILTLLSTPPSSHFSSVDLSTLNVSEALDSNQFCLPSYPNHHQNESNHFCISHEIPIANGIPALPETTIKLTPKESCSIQTSPHHFRKDAQTSTSQENLKKEITLKVRVADTNDPDFIEVDIPAAELSFSYVLITCSRELAINPQLIERVRKLPNTRLRNDRDIQRLRNLEELEFVVKGLSSKILNTSVSSFHQSCP